jgi:hypothetical protein
MNTGALLREALHETSDQIQLFLPSDEVGGYVSGMHGKPPRPAVIRKSYVKLISGTDDEEQSID